MTKGGVIFYWAKTEVEIGREKAGQRLNARTPKYVDCAGIVIGRLIIHFFIMSKVS